MNRTSRSLAARSDWSEKEKRYVHAALLDGSRSHVARLITSVDGSVTGVDTTVMVIRSSWRSIASPTIEIVIGDSTPLSSSQLSRRDRMRAGYKRAVPDGEEAMNLPVKIVVQAVPLANGLG